MAASASGWAKGTKAKGEDETFKKSSQAQG